MASEKRHRLVVGISGASGFRYGVCALQMLRKAGVETHLVVSKAAQLTRGYETELTAEDVAALADKAYEPEDIAAAIASGSFPVLGMLVAPCSVHTLSEIATGVTTGLMGRAADVTLKQRRPLVLMFRETPVHLGHLRSMQAITEMGGIVFPPVPAFYQKPKTIDDIVAFSVGRALELFGLEIDGMPRWGEAGL